VGASLKFMIARGMTSSAVKKDDFVFPF